jgi:hypothetical protein
MSQNDPLKDLNHLQRYLVEEYVEDYQERAMTRRQLLKYVAAVVGSLAVANTVLAACARYRGGHCDCGGNPSPRQNPAAAKPHSGGDHCDRHSSRFGDDGHHPYANPQPVPTGVLVPMTTRQSRPEP